MKFYKHLYRKRNPNLYDLLNIQGSKTINIDNEIILYISRISGSLVGLTTANRVKGHGNSRIYQLRDE